LVIDGLWKIDHCLYCGGTNSTGIKFDKMVFEYVHLRLIGICPDVKKVGKWAACKSESCQECNGSNQTKVWACPRRLADTGARLLPYFFEYYNNQKWPDGRGTFYQPLKLVQAFDLMAQIKSKIDMPKDKKWQEK